MIEVNGHVYPCKAPSNAPDETDKVQENLMFAAETLESLRNVPATRYVGSSWQEWIFELIPIVARFYHAHSADVFSEWIDRYVPSKLVVKKEIS